MSVIKSDPHFHLRRNLATSRVWAEAPVAFQPSLDLHPLSVRECWLCVHEPPHGAVPFLSYVLLWPFHALSCSKEVLPFQRAFPVLLSYRTETHNVVPIRDLIPPFQDGRKFKFILDSAEMQAWIKRQMRCITTPKTTDNKSAAG